MIRLLKVTLQPVFVLDTEDGLREVVVSPVEVSGAAWAAYVASGGGFDQAAVRLHQDLEDST